MSLADNLAAAARDGGAFKKAKQRKPKPRDIDKAIRTFEASSRDKAIASRGVGLIRADALKIPLRDESVDLIVTSPPYFQLRSYQDGGEHYEGQIGSEATPQAFIDALIAVTAECVRVLKPSGSMFVNLGDSYSRGSRTTTDGTTSKRSSGDHRVPPCRDVPAKSLMLLPERYRIACVDQLGLIARAVIIWSKLNGLPESVTDRVRRSHEDWVHLTKAPRYYAAVDEIREAYAPASVERAQYARDWHPPDSYTERSRGVLRDERPAGHEGNPLGKLPGSVWRVPSEPLKVPDWVGVDHYAAYPQEFPRRLILGWTPPGHCCECGEARTAVVEKCANGAPRGQRETDKFQRARSAVGGGPPGPTDVTATISGYRCGCPTPDAPTRPAVVLDPFVGTGTTVMVARALGRTGVGIDLSADYLRLARWRIHDSKTRTRAFDRTYLEGTA